MPRRPTAPVEGVALSTLEPNFDGARASRGGKTDDFLEKIARRIRSISESFVSPCEVHETPIISNGLSQVGRFRANDNDLRKTSGLK